MCKPSMVLDAQRHLSLYITFMALAGSVQQVQVKSCCMCQSRSTNPHSTGQPCSNSPTCEPVAHALVLDLPDARGFCVDIADGGQLMRKLCLLGTKADGVGVLRPQWLRLTVHLQWPHQSARYQLYTLHMALLLVSQQPAGNSADRLISQPATSCTLCTWPHTSQPAISCTFC